MTTQQTNSLRMFILLLILIVALFLVVGWFVEKAEGAEVPDEQAIRACIGEASGEGYRGMLFVAVGIRNRGHLRGVYGVRAKHIANEPQWVWKLARKAWVESKHNRLHSGTHWGSKRVDKAWLAKMEHSPKFTKVAEWKGHIFYKEHK